MAFGMATAKVTVTLDSEQIEAVRALVASGKAKNVSSFVQHAVAVSLADVAGWGAALALALERTGGALTSRERAWADTILRSPRHRSSKANQRKTRRRRRAA